MTSLIGRLLATSAVVVALSMTFAGMAPAATIIETGFNLFKTQSFVSFGFTTIPIPQVVDFKGVPLGTFDFGSGPIFVGDTDTIIERVQLADLGGGTDTIDIELVAISLVSVAPVDLGFGAGFEDITMSLNTSLLSDMTIFDTGEGQPHGTFDSVINFTFDITGSIGGFYGTPPAETIIATNQDWQHEPTGSLQIDGVNHLLNGSDESSDFWPIGVVVYNDNLKLAASAVPEPGTAVLFGSGLAGLAALRRRKR